MSTPGGWSITRMSRRGQRGSPRGAAQAVRRIMSGVKHIARHPRIGLRLPEFEPREVRKLFVGDYEIRYEVREQELLILRIWHVYEDR